MPLLESFWDYVDKSGDCWMWRGSINAHGYGQFSIRGTRTGPRLAHRLAYELANGAIPDGLHICHRCDVTACVRPEHLFAGTRVDNMRDAVEKGRAARGNRHGIAKLTEAMVVEIKGRLRTGAEPMRVIASDYGVSTMIVLKIKRGELWTHVPGDVDPNTRYRAASCKMGHHFTPQTTSYSKATGRRFCRICYNRRQRERKAKLRALLAGVASLA